MISKKADFNLQVLTADAKLKPFAKDIKKISSQAINQVKKLLPFKHSVDIVVYRYNAPSKDFAVSGYTPTGNLVWIYTDPTQLNYKKLLHEQLRKVIVHELHHACRWQGPGYGNTLADALVTEGLAAHFEQEVLNDEPSKFYIQFSVKKLKNLFNLAKKELNSKDYNYSDWFFGNKKRKIPQHAGYALAYYLTSTSTQKSPPSKLVFTKTGQILGKMIK